MSGEQLKNELRLSAAAMAMQMSIDIDKDVNDRLEVLSLERNQSKGFVALTLCEIFFGKGVPHRQVLGSSTEME